MNQSSRNEEAYKIIKESEKHFRLMADNSPVMIWMTDAGNNLEYINKTKLEFLDRNMGDLSNEGWLDTRHPDDRDKFLNALLEASVQKKNFSLEIRVKDKNGDYRWLLDSAAPRFLDDGTFAGFIGSGVDITDRKKADAIINESEKRFRLMADNSPVMIWMTDAENNLEYINKTKLEFLGSELHDLTNEDWKETRHPDDRKKFLDALYEASNKKKNFSIEIRVKNKKGEYRWLLDSAAPRFLDDGTFAGFIGSGIDITDEKKFKNSLQKSLKEKEVLLTEIHHRVKNNLQVISSLLNLQSSNIEDKNVLLMFQTCTDRIRSMAILHEKLYQSNNIYKVNFREYLDDLLSYLFMSYRQTSNVKLKTDVIDIHFNIELSLALGLILNELVSNALKHAFKGKEHGEIFIELKRIGKNRFQLMVTDDGVGIPEDYNLDESKSLGLLLVNSLVEQSSGTMEINRNGRTEFKIELQYDEDTREEEIIPNEIT